MEEENKLRKLNYDNLKQTDKLSYPGYKLQKTINNIEGQIEALKWVVDDIEIKKGTN